MDFFVQVNPHKKRDDHRRNYNENEKMDHDWVMQPMKGSKKA